MKQFRNIIITSLLTIGAFSIVLVTGCKDKCGGTTCQNGGVCTSSVCECPTGYSGSDCGTSWTGAFLGTYNCTRGTCTPNVSGTATWQSSITVDPTYGGYEVDISNFDNNGSVIAIAQVDSSGVSLKITPATYGISGYGTRNATTNEIDLNYTTSTGTGSEYTCSMKMTKL